MPRDLIPRLVFWASLLGALVWATPKTVRILRARLSGSVALATSAGPTTAEVTQRVTADGRPVVDIGRVGLRSVPDWVDRRIFRAVMLDLEPRLRGEVEARNELDAVQLRDHVGASPWLSRPSVQQGDGASYVLGYDLRRPEVFLTRDRADGRDSFLYVAEDGTILPSQGVDLELPAVTLENRAGLAYYETDPDGRITDPRVLAAIRVAQEWREEVAPRLPEDLPLVAVDCRNLGWEFIRDFRYSQVLVGLRAVDGETVWFQSGRAGDDHGPIDGRARAEVLLDILRSHPGLRDVARGDLRLKNTWESQIQLRD